MYEKSYGFNPFGLNNDGTYKSSTVKQLMDWGKNKKIFHQTKGKLQISRFLKRMKPGDVLIWKSPYTVKTEGGQFITRHASHCGIVKEIRKGVLTTIEGNANVPKKNKRGEFLLVKNLRDGVNGCQDIGDFQQMNRYNGVISKKYKVKDLVESGFSGYIDMQKISHKDRYKD
jgi:hypothetical protein